MSIFLLLSSIISTIEKIMNYFWWGHGRPNNRGINWMSWEKLLMHKNHGCMGFKDLTTFNFAMIGKQGWKFQTEPDSLVSRIYKARYFPSRSYLTANLGHNPSYVWRSILRARFIVHGGAHWCVGTSQNISILDEPWLLNGDRINENIVGANFVRDFFVSSLMNTSSKGWNQKVIQQVFSSNIADSILQTPLVDQVVDDRLIWKAEKNGLYSVKRADRLCMEELVDVSHLQRSGYWSGIWTLKLPPKIKNLLWRMCCGCLPTRVRLQDKGVQCLISCVSCDGPHEDLAHICFECPFTAQVWRAIDLWNTVHEVFLKKKSAVDAIFELLHQLSQEFSQRFAAILWSLWKHRNLKLWQDVTETYALVVDRACHLMEDWYAANATIPVSSHNNISTNSIRNDKMSTTMPVRQSGSGTTQNSSATTGDMASVR